MHKDLYNSTITKVANPPAVISTDTATAGVIIDTQGYESAIVQCYTGAVTTGDVTCSVTESNDSGMAGATAITGDFIIGSFTANSTANTVVETGIIPTKRYIQVTITSDNTASLTAGSNVTLGHAVVAGK